MSERLDVRRMLLRRGWTEGRDLMLRKNGALWAVGSDCGDSGLDAPDGKWSVAFDSGVPARVIVAACEAAVPTRTRTASPADGEQTGPAQAASYAEVSADLEARMKAARDAEWLTDLGEQTGGSNG